MAIQILLLMSMPPYCQKAFELYATGAYSMELLRKKIKKEYDIDWSQRLCRKDI